MFKKMTNPEEKKEVNQELNKLMGCLTDMIGIAKESVEGDDQNLIMDNNLALI